MSPIAKADSGNGLVLRRLAAGSGGPVGQAGTRGAPLQRLAIWPLALGRWIVTVLFVLRQSCDRAELALSSAVLPVSPGHVMVLASRDHVAPGKVTSLGGGDPDYPVVPKSIEMAHRVAQFVAG